MEYPAAGDSDVLSFGPFKLAPSRRLLLNGDIPVALGARALDLLIALASRPNEVVSKYELLQQVWPDATVDEGSLRFHMANLRKAIGDATDGARYIATLTGRGYCFVAPVARLASPAEARIEYPYANLPGCSQHMVGRADDIAAIVEQLTARRFVTIVGTGGVGKTTAAVAVGHELVTDFGGAVHLVDLGALGDPALLASTIATMLGFAVHAADATAGLVASLRERRMLLILDTCEHLIDAAAMLASAVFAGAPQVHLLATSREGLRTEGENVHILAPLACPPDALTMAETRAYPAAQLFLDHAAANGARLELDDGDAPIVADICRRLDGVPLAIELAAARVAGYGLHQTAMLLDQRMTLLWPGLRTAPSRQKTLQATLDWSFDLLSPLERTVLRRLAIFVGQFTIEAAQAVVASSEIDRQDIFGAIDGLVAKSMVAVRPAGAMVRYRLLDTTRTYAAEITDPAERAELAASHALHSIGWLEDGGADWPNLSSAAQRSLHIAGLANVRAALEWCFGPEGDRRLGIRVAAAAGPVFLSMSLLTECHRWSALAVGALEDGGRGGDEEVHLQAALGTSLMFTRGGHDEVRVALERGVAVAERTGNAGDQLQVLGPLQMFHLRTGDFNLALHYAERCALLAATVGDAGAMAVAQVQMGISLHLGGELDRAGVALEAALQTSPSLHRAAATYLGFDGRILAGVILARNFWLQGHPVQAAERARLSIRDAVEIGHPLTLSIALIWSATVSLWASDLEAVDEHLRLLFANAEPHALVPHIAVGHGFEGDLAIRRGNAEAGVASLTASLEQLHAAPYELLTTPLDLALVAGVAALGRHAEALGLVDRSITRVEANGDLCYLPELLRVKANLVLTALQPGADTAEQLFRQSLDLARRQRALAWELRTATDLAGLMVDRGRVADAKALLWPLSESSVEGSGTSDGTRAKDLLAAIG